MKTAVILLNWNGADDTVMCLDEGAEGRGAGAGVGG